jgi:hypothetical protein
MSSSVQFILTKMLLAKSKLSILTFAMWVYIFGSLGSFTLYLVECLWRGHSTVGDMPFMLSLIEEVIAVFVFSCINEIANYILLLYFIRKTLVTKASVYGIVGSIFIIFVSIFSGRIKSALLWVEICVFLTSYVIIFLTKRREKRLNKGKSRERLIRYIKDQPEDEVVSFPLGPTLGRELYPQVLMHVNHFSQEGEEQAIASLGNNDREDEGFGSNQIKVRKYTRH